MIFIAILFALFLVCALWDFVERRKIRARWERKQYDRRFNIEHYKRYEERVK